MIIYFIRHGQTDYNLRELVQGTTDIPLNETGLQQAKVVRRLMKEKDVQYDKIYCSPLQRAIVTCEIATGQDRSNFITDRRLREIETGPLSGRSFHDTDEAMVNFMHYPDRYVPPRGAESFQDLVDRTGAFLEDLRKHETADKVLVACHRGIMQSAIFYIKGDIPMKDFRIIAVPNASIMEVEADDTGFRIRGMYFDESNRLKDEDFWGSRVIV